MSILTKLLQPAGVDLFCTGKKFLVFNMVGRNLKVKYRRSFLGFFWTLLNPMASALVFYFVFKVIIKVQVPHYLVFILSGILPWAFFSQTIMENMEALVGNIGLLSKVPIPVQVFPFVGSLTNLVTFCLALPILFGIALITDVNLGFSLFALAYFVSTLFLTTYSLALSLSVLCVYFRDLRHIMGLVMQLWFYATPVVYHESMIPEHLKWLLNLNPVGNNFIAFHRILVDGQWPTLMEAQMSGAWTVVFLISAIVVRKYFCKNLVECL